MSQQFNASPDNLTMAVDYTRARSSKLLLTGDDATYRVRSECRDIYEKASKLSFPLLEFW